MYIDSIINKNTNYALSAFNNVLICSNDINADKTITFPIGYNVAEDFNLSFKILFTNGHNCIDDSTHMTLSDGSNAYPIVVNKDGTLIPLPIHTMEESGVSVYKSLQPNTILEMYFDSTYATNTGAFVVIGNPIVLSSDTYTIYANGKVGDGNVGDIKAISLVNIPSYGWLLCDGSTFDETLYPALFLALGGNVLPDLRNRFLEGADSVVREYKEAGLPNITGSARNRYITNYLDTALGNPSGAFQRGANLPKSSYSEASPETSGQYIYDEAIDFNAKDGETKTDGTLKTEDEHHVYGSSDTVQPASYTVNYIIKAK